MAGILLVGVEGNRWRVATWGTGSAEAGAAVSCVPLSVVGDVGVEGGCSTRRRGQWVLDEA
jgi:hypothetical protein